MLTKIRYLLIKISYLIVNLTCSGTFLGVLLTKQQ